MSCSSAIYMVGTNQTVAPNGQIPLGSIVRRFGKNVALQGSDIVICGAGYYDVEVSTTLSPVTAGEIGVQLYLDGTPVPGAFQYGTGTAGGALPLSFHALVRLGCCDNAASLSLRLDSLAATTGATVDNVGVVVEKI